MASVSHTVIVRLPASRTVVVGRPTIDKAGLIGPPEDFALLPPLADGRYGVTSSRNNTPRWASISE